MVDISDEEYEHLLAALRADHRHTTVTEADHCHCCTRRAALVAAVLYRDEGPMESLPHRDFAHVTDTLSRVGHPGYVTRTS